MIFCYILSGKLINNSLTKTKMTMINAKNSGRFGARFGAQSGARFDAQFDAQSDAEILHQKFSEYGANAKEWMKKCVLLLPEIDKRKIWARKGFFSIYEYAAKLAGMNREKVNESLRVLNKITDKIALRKVIEKKGLNAVKPIITIATIETQNFWAEKAMQLTKNELETYVRDFRNGMVVGDKMAQNPNFTNSEKQAVLQITGLPRKADQEELPRKNSDKANQNPSALLSAQKITMDLLPETASKLEKLKGDGDWETLMQEFLALREEKIESEKPEVREATSRHIPAEIKKYVLAKYNSRCAFPGCNKLYSQLHHTDRFFFEGRHDPATIIPLCVAHHSLAHKGLMEEGEAGVGGLKGRFTKNLNLVDRMVLVHRR